jgi:two-component system phosphate regulon response regulator PhoB
MILVIDDNPDVRFLLMLTLEHAGFDVWTEPDGQAGLEAAGKVHPDLVLVDRVLPGRGGLEVCRELRSRPGLRHVPIIVMSSSDGEADMEFGYAAGADDCVLKPFVATDLLRRVQGLLERGKRERGGLARVA